MWLACRLRHSLTETTHANLISVPQLNIFIIIVTLHEHADMSLDTVLPSPSIVAELSGIAK